MKNRRLAIFLVIFVFLAVVIVLSSAVFSLHSVELRFLSTTSVLTGKESEIVESGNFKIGENVFFSTKKNYIKQMEKANPYVKQFFQTNLLLMPLKEMKPMLSKWTIINMLKLMNI